MRGRGAMRAMHEVSSRRGDGKKGYCRDGSASRRSVKIIVWRGAYEMVECSASCRERIALRDERSGGSPKRVIGRVARCHRQER